MTEKSSRFETEPCTRCGGSGEYSFNLMWGTRCFGCGGRGVKYTKRGAAALAFLTELLSKRIRDLAVGDLIKEHGEFRKLEAIEVDDTGKYKLTMRGLTVFTHDGDRSVRVGATAEQKADALAQALAYQESLTKLGKPRRRKAVAS